LLSQRLALLQISKISGAALRAANFSLGSE